MKYKILGYGILVLILAAIVAVTLNYQMSHQITPPSVVHEDKNIIYTNSQYGFEFTYPKIYKLTETPAISDPSLWLRNGIQIVRVDLPKGDYPKTNLSEAWADFSVGKNLTATDCGKYIDGADKLSTLTQTKIIGDKTFLTAEVSGAGAGNFYETRLYRIFQNDLCFEIALNIHTTNIGNYDPSQGIHEVDKNNIWNKLNNILEAFEITDQQQASAFCGGIAAILCPEGYSCQLAGTYPDAGGRCVKNL